MGTAATLLAGCVDDGGDPETSNGGSNASGSNGNSATGDHWEVGTRPHCEIEPETIDVIRGGENEQAESVGTIPYPAVPEGFTEETVLSFVEDHERAYVRHDYLCGRAYPERTLQFSYSVIKRWVFDSEELFEARDGFTVAMIYVGGATEGVDSDGHVWVTDLGYSGVVYESTDEGIARVDFDELVTLEDEQAVRDQLPDPIADGKFVIEF